MWPELSNRELCNESLIGIVILNFEFANEITRVSYDVYVYIYLSIFFSSTKYQTVFFAIPFV